MCAYSVSSVGFGELGDLDVAFPQVREPLRGDRADDQHPHAAQPRTEYPPSTGIAVPVTKSEPELARKTATPAMSSIVPQRPAGVRRSTFSWRLSTCFRAPRVRSVSIQPGRTALTWMLSRAHAVASDLVRWTTPPLLEPYAGANGTPKMDIMEPMLMILPPPAAFIGA